MSHGLDRYIKRKERKEEQVVEEQVVEEQVVEEQVVEEQVVEEQVVEEQVVEEQVVERLDDQGTITRDWWSILQETVKSMILFPNQLAYTRKNILPNNQSITPEELAIQLGVPIGVALVILDMLRAEQ